MKAPDTSTPRCADAEIPPGRRRPYDPPSLTLYGDLRRVTMGVSPGVGDSLDPFTRKSGGFAPPGPPRR